MSQNESYTPEEISKILKVSKLTVYDLIKKGDIPAFRVGRQMRVDGKDLEAYKAKSLTGNDSLATRTLQNPITHDRTSQSIVVSGQDASLDLLVHQLERDNEQLHPLRSHSGSLDSLIEMYKGNAVIVSTHLFDGDTGTYNIPYIRKLLVSKPFVVLQFIKRQAGFYVAEGNPKNITSWEDLSKPDIQVINREAGAGARVLLDEQMRLHRIDKENLKGYLNTRTSHMDIASEVANGYADVGVGIEQIAKVAPVDFIPLIEENYDLAVLRTPDNQHVIETLHTIMQERSFQEKLKSFGYDIKGIGTVLWEQ